jgi:2-C-methyl-D-erythritol 2,4-cyclodiphosphate synthase
VVSPGGGKPSLLSGLRVGFGFDVRQLTGGVPLCLAGAMIDSTRGTVGEPDGDAVCHAALDAALTAAGLPDLRTVFPPDDDSLDAPNTLTLLSQAVAALQRIRISGLLNMNIAVLSPSLDLREERLRMQGLLASALDVEPGQVSISFDSNERLGAMMREDAVAVFAHLLCEVKQPSAKALKQQSAKLLSGVGLAEGQGPVAAVTAHSDDEDEEDEHLPERAKQFKKATKTKLPPLPQAPGPRAGAQLIVYTDGASRGNPGPAASGWVVLDEQGRLVKEGGSDLGERTNNQAEYIALREAAEWIEQNLGRDFKIQFRSDSELLVKQLKGEYKIKDSQLKQLAMQVMNLLMYFMSFELTHVPRAENSRADALANKVLGVK